MSPSSQNLPKLATLSIRGADDLHATQDVIPPIHTSTTYKYSKDPAQLKKAAEIEEYEDSFVYSRLCHPNGVYIESIVGKMKNCEAVVYSAGLSAFYGAMVHLNPKKICIGDAYHGCQGITDILQRNYGVERLTLAEKDLDKLGKGDVIHIETPLNPTSECVDIQYYADKAHAKGAYLLVDSTFAPLQDPFEFGADMVMHSATKYFGGHSDLLAGLLLTKDKAVKQQLQTDRLFLGTNIGNLESALLNRSLKTFELRVKQQSANAVKLANYLEDNKKNLPHLKEVFHSSLQKDAFVEKQLQGNHSPTFSILVSSEEFAKALPSRLKYFTHATSLGGAESLIEWRCLSDGHAPPNLLRISVGLEDADDLIEDLSLALSG